MADNKSYHFRVTLDDNFRISDKEELWREIEALSSQTLSTLARAIVESFGFDFDHCYGFYDNLANTFKSKEIYELFTDLGEEPTEGAFGVEHIKITKPFDKIGKKMRFLFDYGDNWNFTVELLEIKTADNGTYPRTTKKFGKAPEQYPDYNEDEDEEKTN